MNDNNFIVKRPTLEPSQDYTFLRSEGLKHVEKLAHKLWTDYNIHDPGITLLELFSYAITDLGYRTGYDIADLLTEEDRGIAINRSNFHTALQIFPCNPVTFSDLRKLLIDIAGVRNSWVEKHQSVRYCLHQADQQLLDCPVGPAPGVTENPPLNGLYDVLIEFEDFVRLKREVLVGLLEAQEGGAFIQPGNRGILFDVALDLTIEAVTVVTEAAGKVMVRLLDQDGSVLQKVDFDAAAGVNRIELGFLVPAGSGYRLDAQGSTVKLFREPSAGWIFVPGSAGVDASEKGHVISLISGAQGQNPVQPYFFFYRWEIDYAIPPRDASSEPALDTPIENSTITRADIHLAVKERLHAYRNLCEDFVQICDLDKEEIAVCADIEVSASADVEEVLAEIFYQVEKHISPPVNFYTIDELTARGLSMDKVFEGPALDHGFIDDEEFRQIERRCDIRTSDIIQIIMAQDAVVSIKEISLLSFIDGVFRIQEEWVLDLATDRFRAPDFSSDRSKIIFYKNDLPYYANRKRVAELVKEKKAADLQSKLKGHERDLPVPIGEFRNLEDYYPAQNELPDTYRVGQIRVPESDSDLRKAQARQLKAFLMFFEQILANYLSQLAHVRQLFSWDNTTPLDTYFTQTITEIADIEEIYNRDSLSLAAALDSIIEDDDTAVDRKNRFLEHLIARFCEDVTDYSLLLYSIHGKKAGKRLIEDKQAFLQDYPLLSRGRGGGYDYRFPHDPPNLSGLQRRVYRLLGFEKVVRRRLAGHRFSLEKTLVGETEEWRFVLEDGLGSTIFRSIACETRSSIESLLDFAMSIGGDVDNYLLKGDISGFELVRRCQDGAQDEVIGSTTSPFVLHDVVGYFAEYFDSEGFHVIEHILLRKRTSADPFLPVQLDAPDECDCPEVKEPYSFRATVLLPSWPGRFKDLRFRKFVEETLRIEAPAHVFLKICWISHSQMKEFEECYLPWTESLAALNLRIGACRREQEPVEAESEDPAPMSGQLPLPETKPLDLEYGSQLQKLIDKLHSLVTVYPLARLHDCEETGGDEPQVTLNNTSLGTF